MKNLWIGLIVAMAALIVCGCAMAETTGTCGEDLKWTLTDDGVLTISGTGSMPDYDTVLLKSNDLITTAPWGGCDGSGGDRRRRDEHYIDMARLNNYNNLWNGG